MADPATRVALLARPGAACDNLQAALQQAGADVVAVQDPADGDPAALAAARPGAVLVALEPAVEDALARYDAVLSEPGRLVIYDEVAVAARREGWDVARWARHLSAKLGGHADVLPPGSGSDDDAVLPPSPRAVAPERVPEAEPATDARFDSDSVHMGAESADDATLASAGDGIDFGGFTPEIMAAMAMEPAPATPAASAPPAPPAPPETDAPTDVPPALSSAMDDGGDPNILEWDAPATFAAPPLPAIEPSAVAPDPVPAPAGVRADTQASPGFNFGEMSLVDMESSDGTPVAPPAPTVQSTAPAAPAAAGGAVVVLAGIGGPDAVRQFLAALPAGFARPIVVRQRLDGGRHDRLVRQMQRATALPVELAEAGRALVAGHVYILADGMTTSGDGAATFVATDAAVPALAGLPADRSAVLVLSGSDPAAVPELMEAARDGAFVAGQSPEDSFDGAAAMALVAAGGEACAAAELAQRISARWQS